MAGPRCGSRQSRTHARPSRTGCAARICEGSVSGTLHSTPGGRAVPFEHPQIRLDLVERRASVVQAIRPTDRDRADVKVDDDRPLTLVTKLKQEAGVGLGQIDQGLGLPPGDQPRAVADVAPRPPSALGRQLPRAARKLPLRLRRPCAADTGRNSRCTLTRPGAKPARRERDSTLGSPPLSSRMPTSTRARRGR
jgi:hypothetical protein